MTIHLSDLTKLDLEMFKSDCPEGYDTVLGYLANHKPELLECRETRIKKFVEVSMHVGMIVGGDYHRVVAPLYLHDQGVTDIKAFPIEELAQFID